MPAGEQVQNALFPLGEARRPQLAERGVRPLEHVVQIGDCTLLGGHARGDTLDVFDDRVAPAVPLLEMAVVRNLSSSLFVHDGRSISARGGRRISPIG